MNKYELVEQIGKGSYGKVSLMRDKKTRELVVVKSIKFKSKDSGSRESAKQEAIVLSQLQHPNIIKYLDSFANSPTEYCIVQEFADGEDLQKYISSHDQLSENQILKIFTQIIFGLNYIHSKNILHRDIKTANIFLFANGIVKLGDFGISREISEKHLAKTMIGTPYFMCPEILLGRRYGFPADIWAAGCILFELMTGRHAFTGNSKEELFGNITSGRLPTMPTKYSKKLTNLLCKMLSQDPHKRPTCQQILQTDIVGQGIDLLESQLKKESNTKHQAPSSVNSSKSRIPSRSSNVTETAEDEIDQSVMPAWILANPSVGEELIRQSFRHLEQDGNQLMDIIRSSVSKKGGEVYATVGVVQGNLLERKAKAEQEAKKRLGDEKYQIAYEFIKEHWIDDREQLPEMLGLSYLPETEIKLIEIITMIERYL